MSISTRSQDWFGHHRLGAGIGIVLTAAIAATLLALGLAGTLGGSGSSTNPIGPAPAVAQAAAEPTTIFLVSSQEQAAQVHRDLGDVNAARASFGEQRLDYDVVIIPSDAEAARFIRDHEHANRILISQGLQGVPLEDLR